MDMRLAPWMAKYEQAWESNDPDDIGDLFAEDAQYYTEPFAAPWEGRETILREWLENRDEPGDAKFSWQHIATNDDLSVIEARTHYTSPPRTFSNLWLIEFDARGQCRKFTEWWMEHPA
ncbi:MAG: nuclear transport factor 2 family protein [Longispora sp.]|nr:nuclear transport factor 2 family protein [Longispora sp. (in: high G+C Gram-positive bacteria)]